MTSPSRLDDLLDAWHDDRQHGRHRTVAELCADCPELAAEVERRIAILSRFEQLADIDSADTHAPRAEADTAVANGLFDETEPASQPVLPGPLGDFVPVNLLGHGGMGAVFLADDRKLHRQVALKVMRPELAADPVARQRFLREARAMAAVDHEHIVTIHAVGEDGATPFLVMPVLKGETLENRLRLTERFCVTEACRISREVATGLAAAHAVGLIHRDIKPGNIWLDGARSKVKILDFGLARAIEGQDITQSRAVLGTPAYMSPEQGSGVAATPRSDLFSLGAVLYRMATGTQPFAGDTLMATLSNLANRQPPLAHTLNPDVPVELSQLIDSLLSKEPERRPASAVDVALSLERIEASLRQRTVAPTPPPADTAAAGQRQPPQQNRKWVWAGFSGAAALLAAVIIITIQHKDGSQSTVKVQGTADVTVDAARGSAVKVTEEPSETSNFDESTTTTLGSAATSIPAVNAATPWSPPPVIPIGESPYDKLDPAAIAASERFDYQPPELVGLIGSHAQRHWGFCLDAAVSPDGKLGATITASWTDGLIIWDMETRTPRWTLPRSGEHGASLEFNSDGSWLYVCSFGFLDVYDLTGPKPIATRLELVDGSGARNEALHYIDFCENGRSLLVRGWTDKVALFDFADGKPVWTESKAMPPSWCIVGDRYYYRTNDGIHTVPIQNARFGEDQRLDIQLVQSAGGIGVRPDGQRLVVNEKDHIELWDLSQSPPVMITKSVEYDLHSASGFQFSADGRWLLGYAGSRCVLYQIDDRQIVPEGEISYGLGLSPHAALDAASRRLIVGCSEGFVRFWDLSGEQPQELSPFRHETAMAGNSWNVTPTPNSRGDQLMVYPFPDAYGSFRSQLWTFGGAAPEAEGNKVDLLHVGQLYPLTGGRWLQITSEDGRGSRIFQLSGAEWSATGHPFADLVADDAPPFGAVSRNGHTAILEVDPWGPRHRLQGWDLADQPRRAWELELEFPFVNAHGKEVWIADDGDRFATLTRSADANGLQLALWRGADTSQPQPAGVIPIANARGAYRADFSPDGRTLAHFKNNYAGEIVLEDISAGEPHELARITDGLGGHEMTDLAFSPDGRWLAFSMVRGVGVIDCVSRKIVWEYGQFPGTVDWVRWAPDGRHLLIHNGNKTIYVLRLTGALPVAQQPGG